MGTKKKRPPAVLRQPMILYAGLPYSAGGNDFAPGVPVESAEIANSKNIAQVEARIEALRALYPLKNKDAYEDKEYDVSVLCSLYGIESAAVQRLVHALYSVAVQKHGGITWDHGPPKAHFGEMGRISWKGLQSIRLWADVQYLMQAKGMKQTKALSHLSATRRYSGLKGLKRRYHYAIEWAGLVAAPQKSTGLNALVPLNEADPTFIIRQYSQEAWEDQNADLAPKDDV